MFDQPFDIRKYKMGGWESAKLKTKTNGKWYYIYNSDNHELVNCKELIDYDKKYTPPNHKHYKPEPFHVKCVGKMDTGNYRAPLQFQHQPSLIAPIVYGSFSTSHPNIRNAFNIGTDPIRKHSSSNSFSQTTKPKKNLLPHMKRSNTSMNESIPPLYNTPKKNWKYLFI